MVAICLKTNFRKKKAEVLFICVFGMKSSQASKKNKKQKEANASKCFCDGEKYCLSIYNSHRAHVKIASRGRFSHILNTELLLPVIWGTLVSGDLGEFWKFSIFIDTGFLVGRQLSVGKTRLLFFTSSYFPGCQYLPLAKLLFQRCISVCELSGG